MPGANYFLSKLATQTPGPLVGSTVSQSEPSPCLELVPKPIEDEVKFLNNCRDIVCIPHKDPEVYEAIYPRPKIRHYNSNENRSSRYSPLPISMKGLDENPVGELQELCTKMRWVFPSYTVCCENGQPHERTFVIAVQLYNATDKGEAKSKKAAKREAARSLLFQLLTTVSVGQRYSTTSAALEYRPIADVPKNPENGHRSDILKQACYQSMSDSPKPSVRVSQHLQPYQDPSSHARCIDMLQELALRRNLRVVYIRLDSRTSSGLIKVMLQISTCPIIVVSGQGQSVMEAQAEAALNALECIRITAKKMPFQSINLNL